MVMEGHAQAPCVRGQPVACGSLIRLMHVATGVYLHSHLHSSPISMQQEVSGFNEQNAGDDWKIVCVQGSHSYWMRDADVRLSHGETSKYLHAAKEYQYRHPIPGQLEISAVSSSGKNTLWQAAQGFYYSDNPIMS
jgi:dolichyl-phosphate-mannose--protein O-mannosyl transferase